jgi:hypothetical protein
MCAYALGRRRGDPGVHQLDHLFDREAMRQLDRLGAGVAAEGEQLERAAAVRLGTAAELRHLVGGFWDRPARLPDSRTRSRTHKSPSLVRFRVNRTLSRTSRNDRI